MNTTIESELKLHSELDEDFFSKSVVLSLFAHFVIFFAFTVKTVFFSGEPIVYENAIKVDLVALPDKLTPDEKAAAMNSEPAPKPVEPPAPAPPKPVAKEPAKINDAVNLTKTKSNEKAAFKKLREMEALEKIQKQINADQRIKEAARVFKGNQISTGSDLKGIAKIDHDNYISNVKRKIYDNWDLPEWLAQKQLSAQVLVRYDDHGNLIFKKIIKSSGNPNYDDMIIETIEKSSPVPAPPEKLAKIINNEGILIGFPE